MNKRTMRLKEASLVRTYTVVEEALRAENRRLRAALTELCEHVEGWGDHEFVMLTDEDDPLDEQAVGQALRLLEHRYLVLSAKSVLTRAKAALQGEALAPPPASVSAPRRHLRKDR
jgi:hypothetical protein